MISAAWRSENILYSNRVASSKDSADLYLVDHLDLSYETVNSGTSYKILFSFGCEDCSNSAFLFDYRNCSDCFGCTGLRNKSYYIFNKPYSKEDYKKAIKNFDLGSYKKLTELKETYGQTILNFPRKYMYSFKIVDVVGDIVGNTKNCYQCFDVVGVEDFKYAVWGGMGMKDSYDGYGVGGGVDLLYESVDSGISGSRVKFTIVVYRSHDVEYSFNCHNSNNLFGCVGLRNKSYCILNRQYSKEDYEKLISQIIEHMNSMPYTDSKGRIYRYGEFFPPELSPFSYNETIAQEYFPLTKEEAIAQGYTWKEDEKREYTINLTPESLPDHIKDVDDSILTQNIGCSHQGTCNEQCTSAFRIIPQELEFYRKMNLPLPRLCPNCRHYSRLKQRNPLKLWKRRCMCNGKESRSQNQESIIIYQNQTTHFHSDQSCPNEFETSYSPERKEIIYCESCYNSEIV